MLLSSTNDFSALNIAYRALNYKTESDNKYHPNSVREAAVDTTSL